MLTFDDSSRWGMEFSTLVELLGERARSQPEKTAFIFLLDGETEAARLSYQELDRFSRAIASQLQSMGATGKRALLLYPPGLEFIAAFFGCLYAGVVAVPAYPPRLNHSMSRLLAIVASSQASVALTTTSLLTNIEGRVAQNPELAALDWLATDNIDNDLAGAWQEPAVLGDTLAFLQYTSGSTGMPKGVMVTHGNLLHNLALINKCFKDTPDSLGVSWLPPYHDMGLIGGVLQPLYVGAPMILMSPMAFLQKPFRWLLAISRYKATTSGGPNFAYDLCIRNIKPEQRASLDLNSWQVAFNGAEPIRAETLERFVAAFESCGFAKKAFYPCYGMAETTLLVSGGLKTAPPVVYHVSGEALSQNQVLRVASEQQDPRKIVGLGRTWLEQKIVIVDPESLTQCPSDKVGEIWVSGLSVAQGYWNRPLETEQTFHAYLADTGEGPFLRTGDLGFLIAQELFVTGRLKDVIIIRGRNHYPQDIELTVENSHPALRAGCGAAFSVEMDGEEQLAIAQEVERSHLRNLDFEQVIRAIRQAVVEQHDLEVYAVLLLKTGSIPKTSSGKIQRHACRKGFKAGGLEVVYQYFSDQHSKPGNSVVGETERYQHQPQTAEAIQAWLVSKIGERLRVNPLDIDVREPFARYGLDSVAAVSLSGDLENWLGRRLSPTLVYDYPSIEALAKYLAQAPDVSGTFHVDADRKTQTEAIAIIGLGCRFPGAKDPAAFWQLLRSGVDAITEVPAARWDINTLYDSNPASTGKMSTRWGGFLEKVDQFDPHFFGIAPREAQGMDPQQRLLLEVAWEALENAGIAQDQLAGSQTGAFIGISSSDYSRLAFSDSASIDAYTGTGNALSIAANRLSYVLDLRGPSLAVDTACSSSLVAVHLASQSLHNRECNLAIAGGVNLILSPELTITFSQARMMAADGRCKTFSADADGYVRGEGCGLVVLKRLSDALRDGDNIQALIRGSAINQDGRSNGLTAPNGSSQQAVIHQALENAGVEPAQISLVEAHGTATSLGDPIEVQSLRAVLMQGRSPDQPCWISSVKTNIGHLEAAAGIASLIKVVLSLQHQEIPPHLHLKQLNPYISLEGTTLSIPTERQSWSAGTEPRLAGVSSSGFGGTNCHVILAEAPAPTLGVSDSSRPLHLLTLRAKSEKALLTLARCYEEFLTDHPTASLADVCFTANTGRSHFDHRLAIITESTVQLRQKLAAFAAGKQTAGLLSGQVQSRKRPLLAFLFASEGSQYVGMGRQLYEQAPTFRQTLDNANEILRPYLEKPLLEVLYPSEGEMGEQGGRGALVQRGRGAEGQGEIVYAQTALFALEYALVELWKSWGIEPSVVMGDGVGEYVAACVAGVFSLEDGLKLIASKGRLIMADFERVAFEVTYSLPRIGLVSNVTGELATSEVATPEYWVSHVQQQVRFAQGRQTLERQGCSVFVEVGFDGTPLPKSPSAQEPLHDPDWQILLQSLGELYVRGVPVDWSGFDLDYPRRRLQLPTYPFQRQRYWVEKVEVYDHKRALPSTTADSSKSLHPLVGERVHSAALRNKEIQFSSQISQDSPAFLLHYRVFQTAILPATAYLEMVLAAGATVFKSNNLVLEEVSIQQSLILPEDGAKTVQLILTPEGIRGYSFQIFSLTTIDEENSEPSWTVHASGKVLVEDIEQRGRGAEGQRGRGAEGQRGRGERELPLGELATLQARYTEEISVKDYYQEFRKRGIDYGPSFQAIERLWQHDGKALGEIRLPEVLIADAGDYQLHPVLLDACFQILAATLPEEGWDQPWVLVGLERLCVYSRTSTRLWSYAQMRQVLGLNQLTLTADLNLFAEDGQLIATVQGLQLSSSSREALLSNPQEALLDWLYELEWRPQVRQNEQLPPD